MTIEPIGLTIPKCTCWQQQPKQMEEIIDSVSAKVCLITITATMQFNICDDARDYYLASIIFGVISAGIPQKKDDDGSCAMYQKEYEAMYDRLKPLVMQRIDYADAVIMGEVKEG